ncbi:TPA: IS1 family transposase, partial [Citrobacter pasteurii]
GQLLFGTDNAASFFVDPIVYILPGKIFTQRIERNNLTLRTRINRLIRKMICFSRSVEILEKVIGSFIEKYIFY